MDVASDLRSEPTEALIDTGTELSLFDQSVAHLIGLNLENAPTITVYGVGGLARDVRLSEVTLRLLGLPDLEVRLQVGFAPDIDLGTGNLIGLDVLEHFDFALAHADRLGYLGRR